MHPGDEASMDHRSFLGVQLFLRRLRHQEAEAPPDPERRLQSLQWCRCSSCRLMPAVPESVCCRELSAMESCIGANQCVTQYHEFQKRVLDRETLIMHLGFSTEMTKEEFEEDENRNLRMLAYRAVIVLTYKYVPKEFRVPIPSCAISAIREKYPDPNLVYTDINVLLDKLQRLIDESYLEELKYPYPD